MLAGIDDYFCSGVVAEDGLESFLQKECSHSLAVQIVPHHAPGQDNLLILLAITAAGNDNFLELDYEKWAGLSLEKPFEAGTLLDSKKLWGVALKQLQAGCFVG